MSQQCNLVRNNDLPAAKRQLTMVGINLYSIMSKKESFDKESDIVTSSDVTIFKHVKWNFIRL